MKKLFIPLLIIISIFFTFAPIVNAEETINDNEQNSEIINEDENQIDIINNENDLVNEAINNSDNNYEVVFTHEGYELTIPGGSSILLSRLIQKLGINISLSDVREILISDESIIGLTQVTDSNDFVFKSLRSFDTEEQIIINTYGADQYIIKVTDPAGDEPAHNKDIIDNGDGTYTLELSVTGDSIPESDTTANVNIIILYDVSQSMSESAGSTSRGDQAEAVVYQFINDIMGYQNGDNIEMALITFAVNANQVSGWTTNLQSIRNRFESNGTNGITSFNYNSYGTNWDHALRLAQGLLGHDNDQTFIILVTDGAPTATGNSGSDAVAPRTAPFSTLVEKYAVALPTARIIQGTTTDKNELYGIYMYGTEADLLDDLMYNSFRSESEARTPEADTDDDAPNYYNASDTSALKTAVNDVLGKIIQAMGVSSVTISDGTTSAVQTSSDIVSLLEVDDHSFKYYLSMEVNPTAQEDTYTNNTTGHLITFTKQSGDTYKGTWTDKDGNHEITGTITPKYDDEGEIVGYIFEMEWTSEGNDLHSEAPTAAELVTDEDGNDSVDWNLSSHGVLLNGVTYTVRFRVWPSQYTLDLIATLKNHPEKWNEVDDSIKEYLVKDGNNYTLKTNTEATLTFTDTRIEGATPDTATYENPDPVGTAAIETLAITKEWDNDIDGREATPVTLKIYRSGEDGDEEWDEIELGGENPWTANLFISIGIMTVDDEGNIDILNPGHDFSFGELGDDVHNWELKSKIAHPMLINGVLTMLYKHGTTAPTEGTYYKIGDYYYVVGEVEQDVITFEATNERRSYLELEKDVTYTSDEFARFDDELFTFEITISDDNGADIWFSIKESKEQGARYITPDDGLVVTNAVKDSGSNYYVAKNGDTFTVKIKKGWNVRIINLLSGTSYTIKEIDNNDKFDFSSTELTIFDPDAEDDEGDPDPIEGSSITLTGTIEKANMKYQVKYININVSTEVTVTKDWLDKDNEYETRPESVTVVLSNGDEGTLTEENGWSYTFENLPLYDENEDTITYTVDENDIEGYVKLGIEGNQADGFIITNILLIDIEVTKEWQDQDNANDTRPDSIDVVLSDGTEGTITAEDNWIYTFEDLPLYDEDKNLITYEISEAEVDGYSTSIEGDQDEGFVITNSLLIDIEVTKEWVDGDNTDNTRPESITVVLSDGSEAVLNEDNDWSYTFEDMPLYDDKGEVITYEVIEFGVDGYIVTIDGDQDEGFTITNTLVTTIDVTKEWVDNNNADDTRPESITVILSDGSEGTITAEDDWEYTFEDMPVFDAEGNRIEYDIAEVTVDGYTYEVSGDQDEGFTITNTLVTTITVNKEWVDGDNADDTRPESITVVLSDGSEGTITAENDWEYTFEDMPVYDTEGNAITYEVSEVTVDGYTYEVSGDQDEGFTITNTLVMTIDVTKEWVDGDNADDTRPDSITVVLSDGSEGTITAEDDWEYTFEDLPVFDAEGNRIEYDIAEVTVDGYTYEVSGDQDEGFTITNTLVTTITVNKEWVDGNNADDTRPESITVILSDGSEGTITAEEGWEYTFEDLPVFDTEGNRIEYDITEVTVDGYTYEVSGDQDEGFTITNTLVMTIDVTKEWIDNNNSDDTRPESITVVLSDGSEGTITADDGWEYTFEDLPVFDTEGNRIEYDITEVTVDGYTYEVSGDQDEGFTITNTLVMTIDVTKEWIDNNNADDTRPENITVVLSDGSEAEITPDEDGNWSYTFEDLPVYDTEGNAIIYEISEVTVDGYTYEVSGDQDEGFTITNTLVMTIDVTKEWIDGNNEDDTRPESITVVLSDGSEAEITPDEDGNWSYTFEDLPVYDTEGKAITYEISEVTVDGYTYEVSGDQTEGFIITNTLVREITVTKEWDDNDDADGKRPESITVVLSDGSEGTITAEDGWEYTFKDLPVYDTEGNRIEYDIEEYDVDNYVNYVSGDADEGFIITNMLVTEITVTKVWDDNEDASGERPKEITITLLQDGEFYDEVVLSEENDWTYTWENCLVYGENGKYEYSVEEVEVDKYDSVITGSVEEGFTITNTYNDRGQGKTTPEEPEELPPHTGIDSINYSINNIWYIMMLLSIVFFRRKNILDK